MLLWWFLHSVLFAWFMQALGLPRLPRFVHYFLASTYYLRRFPLVCRGHRRLKWDRQDFLESELPLRRGDLFLPSTAPRRKIQRNSSPQSLTCTKSLSRKLNDMFLSCVKFSPVGFFNSRNYVRACTAHARVYVPYRCGVRVNSNFSLLRAAHGPALPLEALIPLLRNVAWNYTESQKEKMKIT